VLSAFTVDESTLPAQQDAAVGMLRRQLGAGHGQSQSKKFVASYELPTTACRTYAMQGYERPC